MGIKWMPYCLEQECCAVYVLHEEAFAGCRQVTAHCQPCQRFQHPNVYVALGCWLQLSSRALCRGAGYLSCLAYVHTCFRDLLLYSSKTAIRHVHLVHVRLSCQVQSATATTAALLSWYVQLLG